MLFRTRRFAGCTLLAVLSLLARPGGIEAADQSAAPHAAAAFDFHENRMPRRAEMHYSAFWGIDSLGIKTMESGELVRFSWRVLDTDKAKPLNDKAFDPILEDPQAGVKLVVPSLEKVGQLRQTSTPIAGKQYWMAFSNKGHVVKRGDRVNVVIGKFRADNLIVE